MANKYLSYNGLLSFNLNLKEWINNNFVTINSHSDDLNNKSDASHTHEISDIPIESFVVETWNFTLEDGSVITKEVVVK